MYCYFRNNSYMWDCPILSNLKEKKSDYPNNLVGQILLLAGHFWPAGHLLPTTGVGGMCLCLSTQVTFLSKLYLSE